MADRVIIEHPKSGERYSVTAGDFRRVKHADGQTYEDKGFKIVSYEDGSEYEPPVRKERATKPKDEPAPEPAAASDAKDG